jgi:hypothetical protein
MCTCHDDGSDDEGAAAAAPAVSNKYSRFNLNFFKHKYLFFIYLFL